MTPEARFKHRIREHLLAAHWDVQAIETSTSRGVPDLSVAHADAGEIWVEVKYGSAEPKIRPEQNAWLTRGAMHGRQCVVVWSWENSPVKFHAQKYTAQGKTYRVSSDDISELLHANPPL